MYQLTYPDSARFWYLRPREGKIFHKKHNEYWLFGCSLQQLWKAVTGLDRESAHPISITITVVAAGHYPSPDQLGYLQLEWFQADPQRDVSWFLRFLLLFLSKCLCLRWLCLLQWFCRCSFMPRSEVVVRNHRFFPNQKNRLACLPKGIADLWHMDMQLYNSFTWRHEVATDGLIP